MERKYKLGDMGKVEVIDMLREKISAGATKIKKKVWREEGTLPSKLFVCNKTETV